MFWIGYSAWIAFELWILTRDRRAVRGERTDRGSRLAMGNWLSLAAPVLCLLIGYAWRIRVEENALSARFGAVFAAHRRRTWSIIPFLW